MNKPIRLFKNDKVAIVSLSSGIAGDDDFNHRYLIGKKRLEEVFNLEVITMPHALLGSSFIYNHPELRAKDLMDAFTDKSIKAIICNIGGDDTIRLLPYIDFDIIKNNPKIFMGYSDSTINHFMMNRASLVSFYGPCVMAEFAENVKMHDYTKDSVFNILFNDSKNYEIKSSNYWTCEELSWMNKDNNNVLRKMNYDDKGIEILQGKNDIQGELIGGCIDTFHMFIGTSLWSDIDWSKKILFLETSEDRPDPSFIAQILRNPLMCDVLKKVKGLIIGKPNNEVYYDEYKEIYLNIIRDELKLNDLFIAYNYNFGHNAPMCVLPLGIKVMINKDNGNIRLLESATKEG